MIKGNLEAVYAVSKKTGRPYKALRLTLPSVDGFNMYFYIFPRYYQWRLLGIKDSDFIHIGDDSED